MRQGQQNRRGRGRNNNNNNNSNNTNHNNHNRKGQNPLSRSYESTGPDTKIRGTPAHIAEKYMQLARDAQSSGDPVLAENYLQHAEHYNRIIMTFREQQMQQNGGVDQGPANGQSGRFRSPGMGEDEFSDDEGDEFSAGSQMRQEPQPRYEGGQRFDEQRQPRQDNQRNQHHQQNRDRGDRDQRTFDRAERGDKPERFERNDRGDRSDRGGDRPERFERTDRSERTERPERVAAPPEAAAEAPVSQRRRERSPIPSHEQPEFLRRPVRRPRRESVEEDSADAAAPASTEENVQD